MRPTTFRQAGNNDVKYDYVLNITDGVQPNPVLLEWARVWGACAYL